MTSSRAHRRGRRAILPAVALAVVQVCCGGSDDLATDETFSQTRTLQPLQSFGLVFGAQTDGTVEVNVGWTSAANDIQVYAASGSCASFELLRTGACNVVAFSESPTAKPETITFTQTSGTTYAVFAMNQGPGSDNVTIQLIIR